MYEIFKHNKKTILIAISLSLFLTIAVHLVRASEPRLSPERRAALEARIELLQYEYDTAEQKKTIYYGHISELDRLQQEWKNEADGHRMEIAGVQPFVPAEIHSAPEVTKGKPTEQFLDALARCENGNPKKNRYGLTTSYDGKRILRVLPEEEARKEVLRTIRGYKAYRENKDFYEVMKVWSPPQHNDTLTHSLCIRQHSGYAFDLDTPINSIL